LFGMTGAATALRDLRSAFRNAGVASADLDARLLLEHICGLAAINLVRDPDQVLTADQLGSLRAAGERRMRGEPVHRILGFRDFHGLRLRLSPDTLEPRPDTEILVDAMAPLLRERVREQGACRLLDLGTGSGAIALALLKEVPGLTAVGVDLSQGALEAALANAHINGVGERFGTLCSDWLVDVVGTFDAIVSNPPYIESGEIPRLAPEVARFDPIRALDGGADGLNAYKAIAGSAAGHLVSGGLLGLEIGWDQKLAVTRIFEAADYHLLRAEQDLGGNDRVLVFRRA
jgi:release factor glutamine methyltransferase